MTVLMRVISVAREDNFTLDAMSLKLGEEFGELAEAVNHVQGRLPHKTMKEPIEGEVADVINCAVAVLVKTHPELTDAALLAMLTAALELKTDKWEKVFANRKAKDFPRLNAEFKVQIYDRSGLIDEANEHDWTSLAYGWALARGLSVEDATDFSNQIW